MRCYCCNAKDAKVQPKDGRYYCSACSSAIRETLADFDVDVTVNRLYYTTAQPSKKVSVKDDRPTDSDPS